MLVISGWVILTDINSKSLAKVGITVDIIIICFIVADRMEIPILLCDLTEKEASRLGMLLLIIISV